ncbi:MBL fold metallo-hydrolase [Profundibacterium mesophilum]|uniref:Beta-lactamase superfamily domain protein n=1 Tax=Profundibacterium mesophilum KAUST100406-0324 TaxID=1037889 RepID=A0A921TC38_9RHOB|nr:MBL fold metallo-hydrolase [Profundibacterium mesophilum]KAF0676620.1 Beta-lactamase superfamily domain protein [Profundibacterium mesophilum KAUST100406-0324]
MKLTHLQSATVMIETNGTRILTDPWLVDGEYYGSWFHYPPYPGRPEDLEYDYIYVSHIHPDHMSRKTMARLDKSKPVLIHDFEEKFLRMNLERMGFEVIELPHNERFDLPGGGFIQILGADNCDPELCARYFGCAPVEAKFRMTRIDTLSVISDGTHVILNTNDCPEPLARDAVDRVLAEHGSIDLMLVGYAGAGPFPQCFAFADTAQMRAAADRKRAQFIDQAVAYIERVRPAAFMPFAGTYVLGGRKGALNDARGVPGLDEALAEIVPRVPAECQGFILDAAQSWDLGAREASAPPTAPDPAARAAYLAQIAEHPYDYDALPAPGDDALLEMAQAAYPRFAGKAAQIGLSDATRIVVTADDFAIGFDAARPPERIHALPAGDYVRIETDRRLLGALLQGPRHAHWNNAEIGSHLSYERRPDRFDRELYHAMSFFHS